MHNNIVRDVLEKPVDTLMNTEQHHLFLFACHMETFERMKLHDIKSIYKVCKSIYIYDRWQQQNR